jgi:hypothetical protein
MFNYVNLTYGGQILKDEQGNPVLDSKGRPQRKYSDEVIDQMVYTANKVNDYDIRIPQVSMLPVTNGVDVQSIINEELTNPESTALKDKLAELDANPTINTQEIKQDLTDVVELSLRRRQYLKEYNDIIDNPQNYTQSREEIENLKKLEQLENEPKQIVKIKTKNGERKIEIGTEYVLGKVTEYSAGWYN